MIVGERRDSAEQAVMAAPPTRSGTEVLLSEMHASSKLEAMDPYRITALALMLFRLVRHPARVPRSVEG